MPSFLRTITFISVFSLFLYIANLVVYEALAALLAITLTWELVVLGSLLGIFSASFIAATVLGMRYYNVFTRYYYTLSAAWTGFFVYFFFASVLYGMLVMFSPTAFTGLGIFLLVSAVCVGIYGIFNARTIRTTHVTVPLPHLPPSWKGRKALWVSDLHLGQLHGPGFAHRIVDKINTLPHDIVFIGGDLFDGTGAPDIPELIDAFSKFSAPLGVYFVTGNHEEFGASERFTDALKAHGIRVLQDEMVEIDGLQLIGVDYHNAVHPDRFREILSRLTIDTQKPSILLKHEPRDLPIAHAAGISLQMSGHTHHGQLWPLGYIARWVYKGFVYGLKSFETMQVYISSGTGTWGPPMRVGTRSEVVVFTFT